MAPGSEREATEFVRAGLRGTRFAEARWVNETGSTNDDLMAAARDGAPEQVLVTDLQTTGRGRRGRVWKAPAGTSILMSVLLRDVAPQDAFWAVAAVGLGASEAILESTSVDCGIKWPNDLLIGDAKVAGVLAQVGDDVVVIGIGINVNWPDESPNVGVGGLAATAINRHRPAHKNVDRPDLVVAIVRRVEFWLAAEREQLRAQWRRRCVTIGQQVRVEMAGESLVGHAVDVRTDGALLIESDGKRRAIEVGDVVHLRSGS